MRKSTFLTFVFLTMFVFTMFAQKSYVNPAAKYCDMLGYRYEITSTKASGDVGMVHLPDGRIVNAWDFYKGKVAQEYSYAARLGFEIETEVVEENGFTVERPICVRMNKGVEERIPLLELMELNGEPLIAEVERTTPSFLDIATIDPNFTTAKALPTSFDWRDYNGHAYIGGARDQGGCGSCYAFGAAAAAEGTYNFATGSYDGNVADFSEAYIAWCISDASPYSSHFSGCNGADYDYYELEALTDSDWGIIDESYFPYSDANNQSCPSSTLTAPKTIFQSWHRVPSSDVDAIKTAIMTYGVVDAAVYVTTSFQSYSGGIWSDSNNSCSNGAYTTTNHAIALVGWGTDATEGDYWILRNSWGSSWGENGYMRISVNSAAVDCAVCYMVYEDIPQPPVANFNADETTIVVGNTINFSDASANNPTSWSWTFEGGTPSTSTSQNPTVTYNTLGTYDVSLTVTNAEGNDTEIKTNYISVVDEIINYCASAGNNSNYEWIAGVEVGDFSNTSGAATYTDFTNLTANLTAGQAYNITLTPGFASTTYDEYWKIWIDLNRDGDFDDSGENVFDQGGMSKSTVTGTITIPAGTASTTTRMRVTMKYNGEPTACENTFSYGEVEDYSVFIGGGDDEAPSAPANLAGTNITMTSVDLNWDASTDNVGVTGYQVYQNGSLIANTANTWYDVTGLNSGTVYSYYVIAEDAAGNESNASNTINMTTLTDTEAPTAPTNLVSSGITQSSFTLSWNASTDNVGVTEYNIYQNGSYLTSTSNTSAAVTGLSPATTYSYYVTAEDAAGNVSGASSTLNVTTLDDVIVVEYCDLYGNSTRFEWIDVFGLNDLYNTSAANGGYGDYTNLSANVSTGTSYTAYVSAGFKRRTYTEYWNVWIDFNVDGDFTSDEIILQGTVADGDVYTATIDIPSTATIGQTRMRVAMSDGGYPSSCGSFRYGEVEDYTVNIAAKTAPIAQMKDGKLLGNDEVVSIKVFPNPAKDELNIEVPYENAKVRIINSTGAIVKELILNDEKIVNISDLATGLYIISVEDEKGPITETFIKQ
ncbi:C1 family peptidase [Bacteroidota bacterium]